MRCHRAPGRPGLVERAEELRDAAVAALLQAAEKSASEGRRQDARADLERALARAPRSGPVLARAADVECAAGERQRALDYYREALELGGVSTEVEERAGSLALELGDDALAVSIFDGLAARDPSFRDRAAEARLAFRIANWPEAERRAARARRLTRAGAASLAWWMFPEVRESRMTSGIVATDVLDRGDGRAMMRAISLGLVDVDPSTHRARPDAPLTRAAAARFLLRLSAALRRPFEAGTRTACARLPGRKTRRPGGDSHGEPVRACCQNQVARPSEERSSRAGSTGSARSFPAGEATPRD